MSASRFSQWWNGFLLMELRGDHISAALQAFQLHGIELYYVKVRTQRCTLGIGLGDFREFYPICRQHGVKIRFIEKDGLPFFAQRCMRRKGMMAGVVLFLMLVYGLSSLIWQVSVAGSDEEAQTAVLQAARESGLYLGAWKQSLGDLQAIQNEILHKDPSLIWVGVQVEGSKAKLEVVKKIPNVAKANETPHNLVAAKPGVIRYVYATRGQSLVKPGQFVRPGQIMISGDLGAGAREVPAEGKVLAEVWYTSKVEMPLKVTQSALTGASVNRDYLVVGPLALRIWGWHQPDYKGTFERSGETNLHVGRWTLPFQMLKVTLYESTAAGVAQSEREAEQAGMRLAEQDVRRQMSQDGGILGQSVLHWEVSHGKLYETVSTRTEEDIGVAAPIQPLQEGPAGRPTNS